MYEELCQRIKIDKQPCFIKENKAVLIKSEEKYTPVCFWTDVQKLAQGTTERQILAFYIMVMNSMRIIRSDKENMAQ